MDNAVIGSAFAAIIVGGIVAIASTNTLGLIAAAVTFVGTLWHQLVHG